MSLSSFRCRRCGACCRVKGGIVRLSEPEIARLAAALEVDEQTFIDRYTTLSPDRRGLVLLDQDDGRSCILLDEAGSCRVHDAKPDQCRNFPFSWTNPDSASYCPALREAQETND